MTCWTSTGFGQMSFRKTSLPASSWPRASVVEVEVHGSGQGVGDDQRRGGQVVHLHVRVDPAFEVAVAGQHSGDGKVVGLDGLGDFGVERAGVADAGRAAVADDVEAELLQVRGQARLVVVVGDNLGTGSHGGLDPRLGGQALVDGVAGQQCGGQHHGRVGRVGAGRDRGDRHRTVVQFELAAVRGLDADRVGRAAVGCRAVRVRGLVREVARGAREGRRVRRREALVDGLVDAAAGQLFLHVVAQVLAELVLGLREDDAVLRALRAGDRRNNRRQVQLEVLGELDFAGGIVPEALFLRVGLHEGDVLVRPAGEAQVVEGDVVDREHGGRGAELRAHVADGGAVGQRHGRDAFAVELHELADHTVLAQLFGDGQDDVGGGRAGRDGPGQLEAHDARDQHGDGLAEHGRLGFDAAHAPAQHAQAVDHGGVGVGADAGVRVGPERSVNFAGHDGAGQVLDVDLVHDAGSRRDDLEVVERGLAPTQELVPLAVALVLDLHVALQCAGVAEGVDLHGVVDHHFGRCQRVDPLGVSAEFLDCFTHGGKVHNAGHASEVLHDHARRRELDFSVGLGAGVPAGQCSDVIGRNVGAVLGPQQVFKQYLEAERKVFCTFNGVQPENFVFGTGYIKFAF